MKALLLVTLALPGAVLGQDAANVGQSWAVNLRAANTQEKHATFGVRLTIIDPQEIQEHRVNTEAPKGSYANPVLRDRAWEQANRSNESARDHTIRTRPRVE